jgi:hypothetical protein
MWFQELKVNRLDNALFVSYIFPLSRFFTAEATNIMAASENAPLEQTVHVMFLDIISKMFKLFITERSEC